MEILDAVRALLELGWPAIVLVMLVVVWRRLVQVEDWMHDLARRVQDVELDQELK